MTQLYPLTFKTQFKDKIWGGNKIKTFLGKDFSPLSNCGETWELSGVEGAISEVKDGHLAGKKLNQLMVEFGDQLMGKIQLNQKPGEFPLLIKFIDAKEDLSIQVHPDDRLAMERHGSFGKTEMWYIMQADKGASLINGFGKEVNSAVYLEKLKNNGLESILNREKVTAGDVFYIPAGRVHTIGKGILLVEIQQSSDVTYRIYDFDRKDASGNKRELHTEEALDAIDFSYTEGSYKSQYDLIPNQVNNVVKSPYFCTNRMRLDQPFDRKQEHGSFSILIVLDGEVLLKTDSAMAERSLIKGDVVLIPAEFQSYQLEPRGTVDLLESYIG